MSQTDFKPPRSLKDALQRFSLELDCVLAWMRNEARHHENGDHKILETAFLVSQLLEDPHDEVETLIPQIERRVTHSDLA